MDHTLPIRTEHSGYKHGTSIRREETTIVSGWYQYSGYVFECFKNIWLERLCFVCGVWKWGGVILEQKDITVEHESAARYHHKNHYQQQILLEPYNITLTY